MVIAVDGSWHTAQPALAFVAAGNHGLASRQGIVHALTLTLAKNSIVTTLATGHGAVVGVLGVGISQAIADKDRLEVDVAILVGQNLGGEDGDVVAGVRLAGDMEVLLGILRELLEEQGQQRINVFTSSASIADCVAAVGIADVDGLVKEDDRGVAVPSIRVVLELDLVINGRWAELEEEAGEGGTARASVKPENDGVVLWVIARLKEP